MFFPVFPLFFHFSFFLYFPLVFFLTKCFFLFHFVSLFFFLGCSKSVAALQDSLEKKGAHSELALFALYWLVVTFPCGIVHILVMIRLRVVYGGRRVGQVLPSYQNRQISALDETADAPQSSLFSLLSSSLQFYLYLSLFIRIRSLAGGPPFSLRNSPHSAIVWPSPRNKGEPPCGSQGGSLIPWGIITSSLLPRIVPKNSDFFF